MFGRQHREGRIISPQTQYCYLKQGQWRQSGTGVGEMRQFGIIRQAQDPGKRRMCLVGAGDRGYTTGRWRRVGRHKGQRKRTVNASDQRRLNKMEKNGNGQRERGPAERPGSLCCSPWTGIVGAVWESIWEQFTASPPRDFKTTIFHVTARTC